MDLGGLLTACSGGPWGCRRAVLTQCSRYDQASTQATSSSHRAAALWSLVPAVLPVRMRSPLCEARASSHGCTSSRVQHDVARRSRRSGGGGACRRAPCGNLPARRRRQTGGAIRFPRCLVHVRAWNLSVPLRRSEAPLPWCATWRSSNRLWWQARARRRLRRRSFGCFPAPSCCGALPLCGTMHPRRAAVRWQ
jgi:hypothetical protein